jgi:hypothetical protein
MLKILGTYGNFQPAANHVRELLEAEALPAYHPTGYALVMEMLPAFTVVVNGFKVI